MKVGVHSENIVCSTLAVWAANHIPVRSFNHMFLLLVCHPQSELAQRRGVGISWPSGWFLRLTLISRAQCSTRPARVVSRLGSPKDCAFSWKSNGFGDAPKFHIWITEDGARSLPVSHGLQSLLNCRPHQWPDPTTARWSPRRCIELTSTVSTLIQIASPISTPILEMSQILAISSHSPISDRHVPLVRLPGPAVRLSASVRLGTYRERPP